MQAYQRARELCFGENNTENTDGPTQALAILKGLLNSTENDVAAKAAYLIAVIHFTAPVEDEDFLSPWARRLGPATPTETEKFNEGLLHLRKAHESGLEEATVLLAQLYVKGATREHEAKIEICLDGEKVGKLVNIGDFRPSRSFAFHLLQPLGETNKAAAKVLGDFAMDFFRFLNNPGWCEKYNFQLLLEQEKQYGMICTEDDLRMLHQKEQVVNALAQKRQSSDDDFQLDAEGIASVFNLFKDPKNENALESLMFFMLAASGSDPQIAKFAPTPPKLAMYEKKIWELRVLGCKNAIRWAQNALDMDCDVDFSDKDLALFKKLMLAYAEHRAAGKTAEFASLYLNELLQERPMPLGCGCHVDSVSTDFFARKPPAAAGVPTPAAVRGRSDSDPESRFSPPGSPSP